MDKVVFVNRYGAGYDLAARRKNATRESTATLKAWLNEHKKNPYPTKGEKIMLAIITKMTLTQVSTWFANARRRLKKENKMTWEPKNKTDEDDDTMLSDEEKEQDDKIKTNKGSLSSISFSTSDSQFTKSFRLIVSDETIRIDRRLLTQFQSFQSASVFNYVCTALRILYVPFDRWCAIAIANQLCQINYVLYWCVSFQVQFETVLNVQIALILSVYKSSSELA